MKRRWMIAVLAPAFAATGILAACGDDDSGAATSDGGGADRNVPETYQPGEDSGADQQSGDGGDASVPPTSLAKFNAAAGELPEGVAVVKLDGGGAAPLVGFAPLGKVVQVLADGGVETYGAFAANTNNFTLGLATDAQNNVYVAEAQTGASPSNPPGVYKIPAGGGTPALFSIPDALNPFGFVNGLDFNGTDLYATDSTGKIFKIAATTGVTSKWIDATELQGDEQDCKLGNGFAIGANGIAHDANNVYVVNTDKGSFLKIANNAGAAGAITVIKKDPTLCGADGLAIDADGTFLVAVNAKNKIVRLTAAGDITTIYEGPPLDTPASVLIDGTGASKRLLVTNAAFGYAKVDGGTTGSSLVSFPLK